MNVELSEIIKAKNRLKPLLHHTAMEYSTTFSNKAKAEIYLKCENRQKTGSFKIRGASNKVAVMVESGDKSPVVASSAGNHAQGVAFAAKLLGLKSTIVMPKMAPIAKIHATEGYGAEVILEGDCYDDAYAKACEICETRGAKFIHPYNDLDVIAGQGTLGLEILEDMPDVDVIVVPAGGGGLLAGVAAAVKQTNPKVKVYGVQAEGADAIVRSFEAKKLCTTETSDTIADGIAVKVPGDITVELINKYVDGMVRVSDSEIAAAILVLLERCKQLVEPAGATPVAAVLNDKIDVEGKKVVCLLSGGNIDMPLIHDLITCGLIARHRLLSIRVKLADKPGSLVTLLDIISKSGANILSVEHFKASAGLRPTETNVYVSCAVSGKDHQERILASLADAGYDVQLEEG